MKEKLELKNIAPYLPYGLKCYIWGGGYEKPLEYPTIIGLHSDSIIQSGYRFKSIHCGDEIFSRPEMSNDLSIIKPILRPLSDLTKEIEHNGEKFVPIVELFKLKTLVTGDEIFDHYIKNDTAILRLKGQQLDEFTFKTYFEVDLEPNEVMFSIASETWVDDRLIEERLNQCGNEMKMFQILFEWHFDVFGLIPKGLAVDINTIDHA